MLESQGEGVLEVGDGGGYEVRSGMGIFIEEQRLAWSEEKPWNVKEGLGE